MTAVPELWRDLQASMPIRGPALLLTGIVRSEPGWVEATARVPAGHPLVVAGAAPCFLGLELGAQAAAAMDALAHPREGFGQEAAVGYLVRVRDASFLARHLPVDTTLRVTARLEGAALPLAIHRITVGTGEVDLVCARIATHRGSP
jgi:predicted hotdog family 3-hydroxylacyl-ACP dehydratase